MKIKLDFESGTIALPAAVAAGVVRASATALRLLVLLAADSAACEDTDAAADRLIKKLKCTRAEYDMALAFWCGAGVTEQLDQGGEPEEAAEQSAPQMADVPDAKAVKRTAKLMRAAGVPEYTSEELSELLENNSGTLRLVDEAQRRLGRMFNPREVSLLVGLQSYLELDNDYIFVLLDYCARVGKTSMRYIETMAFGMYDEGVHGAEQLAERLAEREAYATVEGKFKALIGARGRKLSAKESRFLTRWVNEMKYDLSMIELAYDVTVDSQHEYNPAYMNGILERWYSDAITTPEQVRADREKHKGEKQGNSSFDTDEFFEAALKRSYSDN